MAINLSSFLSNVGQGLTNPKGNLGDFRHAARLFIDDTFRLAPKQKFLFFVNFEISPTAMALYPQLRDKHLPELNMLCKTADLPQYSANIDAKNQYNRKKLIQTAINYTPVTITLHDDNQGVTTYLLEAYYNYYYRDGRKAQKAGAYLPRGTYAKDRTHRYGLDNDKEVPFFNSIRLYQMSRQQFTEYTLVNPIIERWGHDSVDYSDNSGVTENTMIINYESVKYDRGEVKEDSPSTFAKTHYDTVPSPLTIKGGGVGNLFGEGGVLDGGSSIIGDIASGEAGLGTILAAANTVKNAKKLSKEGLKAEGLGFLTNTLTAAAADPAGTLSGLPGTLIPGLGEASTDGTTIALAPDASLVSNKPPPSVDAAQKSSSAQRQITPSSTANMWTTPHVPRNRGFIGPRPGTRPGDTLI